MQKRILALILAFLMMPVAALGELAPDIDLSYLAAMESHTVEEREYTVYLGSMDASLSMPLYFLDGMNDMPFVEMDSWKDFLIILYHEYLGDEGYDLTISSSGDRVVLERENGYSMTLDFDTDRITFGDYNAFLHDSSDSSLLDILSVSGFNETGESELFVRDSEASFDRYGDLIQLELGEYNIPMVHNQYDFYVPLQTMSDLLVSPRFYMSLLYNGQAVFMANADTLGNARTGYTAMGQYYYAAPMGERSADLAYFSYNELCFVLDCLYGLKGIHDIDDFNHLFWEISYQENLNSVDPQTADDALRSFLTYYLDDLHSGFNGYSYLCGSASAPADGGITSRKFDRIAAQYSAARLEAYPRGIPAYEEIGNTAYVTFDSFESGDSASYYEAGTGAEPWDTISLIIYAHGRINRQNSPVENVVIDLSNNTGGSVDAALYAIGWFLGDIPFSVKDKFTGAMTTALYRCDVNLDRKFDDQDTVSDKKLYCLISPVSFSSANLVPAAFKSSQQVTLLGRTSGGGSCSVLPLSTAYGTLFQISSSQCFSITKNGSFYDIDQGIEPDCYISDLQHFYDRQTLTAYINSLI